MLGTCRGAGPDLPLPRAPSLMGEPGERKRQYVDTHCAVTGVHRAVRVLGGRVDLPEREQNPNLPGSGGAQGRGSFIHPWTKSFLWLSFPLFM